MAKRKSITGLKKKKRAIKAPARHLSAPNPSGTAPDSRLGSTGPDPDVAPGKRTLLSIQNSMRNAQQGRVTKSTQYTYPKSSLKPTLKHVSQATIQSKWKTLAPPAQAQIQSLFRSVGLPVLAKHANESRKVEAQDAIALVIRSLCKRLPKMPFPQTTKVGHFDYEGLVKSNRELQQRLRIAVDAIASSNAELELETLGLKAERRELQHLESMMEDQESQSAYLWPLNENIAPEDLPDAIGLVSVRVG